MSIRSRYLFAEVAGRFGLASHHYFHLKPHTGSLPSLVAAKSHTQGFAAYPAYCLRPLTPTSHKPTSKRASFHITAKMSALEEGGSSISAQIAIEDKLAGGRKPRGGGRGGRGGGGAQSREVQVSKTLSKLLRHQAGNAGIKLDAEGFAALDEVLNYGPIRSLNVTLAEVKEVVASNEKQRFTMKLNSSLSAELVPSDDSATPSQYLIRANQGHSIKIESAALLEPITLEAGNVPSRVLHGTYFAFWPAIEESGGLKVMGRNHIHCSTGTPEEGVLSGMRKDAELVIDIDVEKSLQDGIQWWKSDNGVLLTEGGEGGVLSTSYFKKVTGRNIDVGVLWEDGERLSSLPEGIKGKVPPGKGPRGGNRRGGGGRGRGRQ
ncbi:2'-phosphotransferase [Trichoderma simmonsii]|uniref:2'-phosphotransferase n=1 Tax=Trichoderma simmonsii TaxID=1491479 RepID=A0A8G0LF38_9HYPO|nr:2'-phosphotransferase [Trichoderma simmonsii]